MQRETKKNFISSRVGNIRPLPILRIMRMEVRTMFGAT